MMANPKHGTENRLDASVWLSSASQRLFTNGQTPIPLFCTKKKAVNQRQSRWKLPEPKIDFFSACFGAMFGLDDLLFLGLSALYTKGEGRKEVEQQKHRGKADTRFFVDFGKTFSTWTFCYLF